MTNQAIKRIIPLLDRILVRKLKPVEKTAAGILIPEGSQKTLHRGEVLAVGPGSEKDKVTLKTGDIVILPTYGGSPVNLGDKTDDSTLLLRESEILAVVVDN